MNDATVVCVAALIMAEQIKLLKMQLQWAQQDSQAASARAFESDKKNQKLDSELYWTQIYSAKHY